MGFGTKAPDELKSFVSLEYSHYIVETYKVKVPTGWMISIPTDMERVCLYNFNKIRLYPDAFHYGMRLPFNLSSRIYSTIFMSPPAKQLPIAGGF